MLSNLGICTMILLVSSSAIRVQGKPQQTKPGCRYEGRRYEEGAPVTTPEPCLQCRCVEGSLRCRLRVCPHLPQPAPLGCRTRPPGENVCCPELVCNGSSDEDETENILQRSKAAASISYHSRMEEAAGCLYEGVRYAPGSAMMGSRRCEYCYCISGARRCIRPKCLLPLPGCAPFYAPHSCCPVAYNCTRQAEFSTTLAAISGNGCRTDQHVYQEGEMVRDIAWKAVCDNCFCAMGAIRCVPLACAPPLQGCKPIVREGQCCPSTYNCSGTIEVKATQNYASYAFISKDYAKFRKESNFYPAIHDAALTGVVEGRGHRIVNEALESDTGGVEIITEKFAMATESILTLETETMNNEILGETTDYPKHTTRDQEQFTATTTELPVSTDAADFDLSAMTTMASPDSNEEEAGEATSLASVYLWEVSTMLEDTSTETTMATATASAGTSPVDEDATATAAVTAITEVPDSTSIIVASVESSENCVTQRQELESTSGDKVRFEVTSSINLDAALTGAPQTRTTKTTQPTSTTALKTSPPPSPSPPPINTTVQKNTTNTSTSKISLSSTTPRTLQTKKPTRKINKKINTTPKTFATNVTTPKTLLTKHTTPNKLLTKQTTPKTLLTKQTTPKTLLTDKTMPKPLLMSSVTKKSRPATTAPQPLLMTSTTMETVSQSSPAVEKSVTEQTTTTTTTSTTTAPTTTAPTTKALTTTTLTTTTTTKAPTTARATKKDSDNDAFIKESEKVDRAEENMAVIPVKKPSAGLSTSILMPDDMLVMNVTVKTNVAVGHIHGVTINPISKPIPPDIEAILNITRQRGKGDDYEGEYDYSEPTLPPSLPNVRIIPFVAADALVKDKGEVDVVAVQPPSLSLPTAVTGYPVSAVAVAPELRTPTDAGNFYDIVTQENRFSPPEKTEGGFVPREPPYFDPLFHSSNLNLEIGTGVTVAPQTLLVPNPNRKTGELVNHCLYEGREYSHGQVLPNTALCIVCLCYYGEIMCSNRKCPPLKIGCKRVNDPNDKCCSKIVCVNGVESPTVVLDRLDSTSSFVHEPTVSPDPFRDVIKTEPAPDLPSLIGNMMMPYLVDRSITTANSLISGISATTTSSSANSNFDGFAGPLRNDIWNESKSTMVAPDRNLVSQHNADNFSSVADVNPITQDAPSDEDDSIFSLDSVLDLFFNDPTTTTTTVKPNATTAKVPPLTNSAATVASIGAIVSSTTSPPSSTSPRMPSAATATSATVTNTPPAEMSVASSSAAAAAPSRNSTTTKKTLEKDAGPTGGLLKLAGCNIYGRMYGVGRIITELSGPCRECRCTDVGVQCKPLGC